MLSPSKICTNCAPVFFEYYQKGLETQAKMLHMREELQRLSFTQQLDNLKDATDPEISFSPHGKHPMSAILKGKKSIPINLAQRESARLDKQASLTTTATILRSHTPSGKLQSNVSKDCIIRKTKSKEVLGNITNLMQPVVGTVSPIERLRDFENQVNKKVESFRKKLREEIAKSAKRSTHKALSSRPKTTTKALKTVDNNENKSAPKISIFSPGQVDKSSRLSPIEFKLTPQADREEKTGKASGPSLGEWTVGTSKENKVNVTTVAPETLTLESSLKKIPDILKKDLEIIKLKTREISSPGPQNIKDLQSPFFSPLRASELTSPQYAHLKPEENRKSYAHFIKPHLTPLLDSLISSPKENTGKSATPTETMIAMWDSKQIEKKSSQKSNYYNELFSNPLEDSPSSKLLKKGKDATIYDFDQKDNLLQDDLKTIHQGMKLHHSKSSSRSGVSLLDNGKRDGDDVEKMLQPSYSYDRTRKKTYDFFKPNNITDTMINQDHTWYIPVNIKGGKFYSINDATTEYRIGETSVSNILNNGKSFSHFFVKQEGMSREAGILVHSSPSKAFNSQYLSPRSESLPKVLLEVKVHGPSRKVDKNTFACSSITPVRAIYSDFDDLLLQESNE